MNSLQTLKEFVFNGLLLDDSLTKLEDSGITVRSSTDLLTVSRIEENEFSPRVVHNANRMASIYIVFFCLENAVRDLIADRLIERHRGDWWNECVPDKIKKAVEKLKEKEEHNRYHAPRSSSLIGYTMFGNLGQIILANWDDFSDLLPSQAWVNSRFTDLEMSRNIIMHTGVLPVSEIERIESHSRDWIRQVG